MYKTHIKSPQLILHGKCSILTPLHFSQNVKRSNLPCSAGQITERKAQFQPKIMFKTSLVPIKGIE